MTKSASEKKKQSCMIPTSKTTAHPSLQTVHVQCALSKAAMYVQKQGAARANKKDKKHRSGGGGGYIDYHRVGFHHYNLSLCERVAEAI